MRKTLVTLAILSLSIITNAQADDVWVGNYKLQIDQNVATPCMTNANFSSIRDINKTINLDNWVYERASVAAICMEVYYSGVTEYFNDNIQYNLTVSATFIDENNKGRVVNARYIHQGNNAVYALELRDERYYGTAARATKTEDLVALRVQGAYYQTIPTIRLQHSGISQ